MSDLIAAINMIIIIITTIHKHHYAKSGGLYVLYRILYIVHCMTHGLELIYKFITKLSSQQETCDVFQLKSGFVDVVGWW
jgi:hypothetical protein